MDDLLDLTDDAVDLARSWLAPAATGVTTPRAASNGASSARHAAAARRLGALVADPAGLDLAVRFIDRVARPEDLHVAAAELGRLAEASGASESFLGLADRTLLRVGASAARAGRGALAPVVVPAARARLRQLVGHVLADAGAGLGTHLEALRTDGFEATVNLLGEAVLGEREARRRLARVLDLARRPDVTHVSVKVSAVAAQLTHWDLPADVARVTRRLLPLARAAMDSGTDVTLDMEAYADLALTAAVVTDLLADPGLDELALGVALQAYLPDSAAVLDDLTASARARVARGGRPLTVRLVKGANLAQERVEAELRGWTQAPYGTKAEVDAAYVALLATALVPERVAAVRVGVAGHNLFHLALAHLLAERRGVGDALHVEMLDGMSPDEARRVAATGRTVRMYVPAVHPEDFDVAVAYLVRRLEEAAAGDNFLHALAVAGTTDGGEGPLAGQEQAFRDSVRAGAALAVAPARPLPRRAGPPGQAVRVAAVHGEDVDESSAAPSFRNEPDSDPTRPDVRVRAAQLVAAPGPVLPVPAPAEDVAAVDAAVARAAELQHGWAATPPAARARVLDHAAGLLAARREALLAAMVHEGGKTVAQADPEVSEAVDLARYYATRARLLEPGASAQDQPQSGRSAGPLDLPDTEAVFHPHGVTVVTPPWNFPVAIPVGSALAALAAGSVVLAKPAPQTPGCATLAYEMVREALVAEGHPADVLQVIATGEGDAGRRLLTHPDVSRVLLTGSTATARLFATWRPELDVVAETSGKNAVVVTPAADVDLAVADVVASAFGHSGQKCSAASLLVLVGSAGRSARLRRQLADAVTSLAVGPSTDLGACVVPLVDPPGPELLRALTELDPGEAWLVAPRCLDPVAAGGEGRAWTPGVRHGVRRGSFLHRTEVFGPVLAVLRVDTLDEAIAVQNDVAFGLTGGLHSLDEAEIDRWLARVEVGNAYVNRTITGAVVERQPFGGWKASGVGPGAKAGGPHMVAQLGRWADAPHVPSLVDDPEGWFAHARADDLRQWREVFSREHDPSGLRVESNVLRFRPVDHLTIRVGSGATPSLAAQVARVRHAAQVAGVPVDASVHLDVPDDVLLALEEDPLVRTITQEDDEELAGRVRARTGTGAGTVAAREGAGTIGARTVTGRVRVIGQAPRLREAAATTIGLDERGEHGELLEHVTVLDAPVVASARRELLTVVREQSVSRTRHRYGHLDSHVDEHPDDAHSSLRNTSMTRSSRSGSP